VEAKTEPRGDRPLHRGDVVVLRSAAEILETLDENGSLDGVPFMPEMLAHFGRRFTVSARVERACDAVSRVRRIPDTVMLDDIRCDGSGHDGCQAGCKVYWKERWLRRVGGDDVIDEVVAQGAYDELGKLAGRNTRAPGSESTNTIYRCQATEFLGASELIPYWDARSFLRELTSRNVSLWTFVRVMAGVLVNEPRRRWRGQHAFRQRGASAAAPSATSAGLAPGSRVRVRSKSEIADTLDADGKLRGLWFDREMIPYCGQSATVRTKVERFINEQTGEMVELASDCYILDGVVCKGYISDGRWLCCREIYSWWREAWLEPEPDSTA